MTTDKNIYQLPNSTLRYDPLELRRKFTLQSQGKFSDWVDGYNDGETELDRAVAEESLVKLTRSVFGLKGVTEKDGVGDSAVLNYLAHYLEWLLTPSESNISPYLTTRPCTDCPPPTTGPSVG